jgi:hypothetical protein
MILLREAVRVARRMILIKDHIVDAVLARPNFTLNGQDRKRPLRGIASS